MDISPNKHSINLIRSLELSKWGVPKKLEGKVIDSFEELEGLIPGLPEFSDSFVDDNEKFIRYIPELKKTGIRRAVAYECPHCKKVIIGPPKMIVRGGAVCRPSADLIMPGGYKAKGSTGIDYICSNPKCNAYLGSYPYSEHS